MVDSIENMAAALCERLMQIKNELEAEFADFEGAYSKMPEDVKASPNYQAFGDKLWSVRALLNTLDITAASLK